MNNPNKGSILSIIYIIILLSLLPTTQGYRVWQEDANSEKILYDYQNFSGFFYDLDNNIGTESIAIDMSNYEDNIIGKGDLLYFTRSNEVSFKFCEWGNYSIMGFLGDKYFAGYSYNSNIINHDINFLKEDYLGKILRDDADINYQLRERIPIGLEEGYKIEISNVNESQKSALLYLIKDKDLIDIKLITFDDSSGYTCIFTKTIINYKDVPFIILHLSAPFEGSESESITIDAIFQISENLVSLKDDFDIPNMDISSFDNKIKIKNSKNIRLNKNSIIPIFKDIAIKVADSDELRFMLIQNESINYRSGPIYAKEMVSYTLTPFNFEGFYYDIDNNLSKEQLCLTISEDNTLVIG